MTVEIKETCCCGAKFFVKDNRKYGNTAEYRYKNFLEAHKICRKINAIKDTTIKNTKGNEDGNS